MGIERRRGEGEGEESVIICYRETKDDGHWRRGDGGEEDVE